MKIQVTVTGLNQKQTFTGVFPSTCDAILSAMDAHAWALSASAKTVQTRDEQSSYVRKPWHILPVEKSGDE
jgi:hypothetical protein